MVDIKKASSAWHAQDIESVFSRLDSSHSGLSNTEVRKRIEAYGLNILKPAKVRGPWLRFAAQFNNVLIYVLLAAAVMTSLLHHWLDSCVIIAVVLINSLIGFIQEGKAEKALAAIQQMLSSTATVLRDQNWQDIPAEQLVPGDIVSLEAGAKVPADLRIIESNNLQIDEAVLTGESVPSLKNTNTCDQTVPLSDRQNIAYSSSLITAGQGLGVVVATADKTEIGRINQLLKQVDKLSTPLLRHMARFSQHLTVGILVLGVLTIAYGVFVQHYVIDVMVLAAVGLFVSAIPEGLPAILTITLAIGVRIMAKRNAIIRRLPAVETLGALTVICTDKTGTLTRNEMTVKVIVTAGHQFEVEGVGYSPKGKILLNNEPIDLDRHNLLRELSRNALLCNDASLNKNNATHENQLVIHGDPTEVALLTMALKNKLDPKIENSEYPRINVIPFDAEHRFMATLHQKEGEHGVICVKGAPEKILSMCKQQLSQDHEPAPIDFNYWDQQMKNMAESGLRLLAIASATTHPNQCELTIDDVSGNLTLLGLIGLIDPPREEAMEAVKRCQAAGIKIKMITGDHILTARAIGRQLGIGDGSSALTGSDIDQFDEQQLKEKVKQVDIFARTDPEHKLKLVSALQANGEIIAMTGDGVNDAPALRRADVGVAMGCKGTEVAKEASEMVLVDDNFASITHAVEQGRIVYDNLQKSILFILPTSFGEAFTIVVAILLGYDLPITAVQILWVNMVTTVTLALALAFEPAEHDVMKRPPNDPDSSLLSGFLLWRVIFVSLIMVMGVFGMFIWVKYSGASIEYARTAAVNTIVMFEVFYLFSARFLSQSSLSLSAFKGNIVIWWAILSLIALQFLFTYTYPLREIFGFQPLGMNTWLVLLPIAVSIFFLIELEKWAQITLQKNKTKHAYY